MKDIVIFGAGGLAREMVGKINKITTNQKSKSYRILGYITEEKYYTPNAVINDYPLLGTEEWLIKHRDDVCCALAIGYHTHERERIFNLLDDNGVQIETIICNDAEISPTCKIGRGCIIGSRCHLSVNMEIGDGTFLNSEVIMGHDVIVGRFCNFSTRVTVSGGCIFGDHVDVGGASYFVPRRKIGSNSVIAAGSVVFTNVKPGIHVLGNPAKKIEL